MGDIANAITFGGLTFFTLGLLALAWHTRISALAFAASIIWLGFGAYCLTRTDDGALWTILGVISILIGLIVAFMPLLWPKPLIQEEDQGYDSIGEERDAGGPPNWSPRKGYRARKSSAGSGLTKSQLKKEYRGIVNYERERDN